MQVRTVSEFIKASGLGRGKADYDNTNKFLKEYGIKDPDFIADIFGGLGVSMKASNTKWIRQDEVNDVFEFENECGELEYIKFPRSMGMNNQDVENLLNE